MRIKTAKSGTMGVEMQGQGPPLLLIHGFPMDRQMWEKQIFFFRSTRRVIAVDLKGYGESDSLNGPTSISQMANEIVDFLEALGIAESVALCGLSMGGYIAQHLIKSFPRRFDKLILCHTRAAGDSPEAARGRRIAMESIRQKGTDEFLASMLSRLVADKTRNTKPEVMKALWANMKAASQQSIVFTLEALASRPDTTDWLSETVCPTLIIAGEDDAITPAAEMQAMAALIPNSRFECLAGCGHLSPLEQPSEFNTLVKAFLAEPI